MKLIVGLGNLGKEYADTRHNAGFWAVDGLAQILEAGWKEEKLRHALICKTECNEEPVILAKPTTLMNLSGRAVSSLVSYYKIKPQDLLIVQDDMDLPQGKFKFYKGGSAAGHHGIFLRRD